MSWSESHLSALLLCLPMLTGCGFQMQKPVDLPPEMATTYIAAEDRFTAFYRKLHTALEGGGVRVTRTRQEAGAVLNILEDVTGQRVLSISARNVPEEYEVFYIVSYTVSINEREVLPVQHRSQVRDYTYDETEVLGKASEEQILREAIADDLVRMVTRQLALLR